jgi:hypothetical protein
LHLLLEVAEKREKKVGSICEEASHAARALFKDSASNEAIHSCGNLIDVTVGPERGTEPTWRIVAGFLLMVAELIFLVPLVADVTLLLCSFAVGVRFTLMEWVNSLVVLYRWALILLGWVPPVFGTVGWLLANFIVQKAKPTKRTQFAVATLIAAVTGFFVMWVIDPSNQMLQVLGLFAGAASGLIVARHVGPQRAILQPSPS